MIDELLLLLKTYLLIFQYRTVFNKKASNLNAFIVVNKLFKAISVRKAQSFLFLFSFSLQILILFSKQLKQNDDSTFYNI